MSPQVSFIGLGNMGTPMALNLLKHGIEVSVYNRSQEKTEPLIKAGAKKLAEPRDAFKASPIVFSMLSNDEALVSITEDQGLLEKAYPGCIHVSLSTVSPDTTKMIAAKHQDRGAHLIAAPVFGRPDAAARQELWICMAGEEDSKKKVEPFLHMLGKKIYDFGPHQETASVVKLSANFMLSSVIEMLSEAFALVKNSGIDPEQFLDFMTLTLFPAPPYQTYGKIILQEKFTPAGFKMKLGLKDLNLFLAASEKVGLQLPLAELIKERFLTSLVKGREEMDWSAISLLSQEKTKK